LRQTNNLIKNADEAHAFNKNPNNESVIKNEGDIFLINEALREPLMHIANKLLGRQCLNFEQLTPKEQELWSLFENSDIYEFLTGKKDTVTEFDNFLIFGATPSVKKYSKNHAKFASDFSNTAISYSKGSLSTFTSDTLSQRKKRRN